MSGITALQLEEALYPIEFARWLDCWDESEVVGVRLDDCACPLACYLQDRFELGARAVSVDGTHVSTAGDTWTGTPDWAREFISEVDEAGDRGEEVSAAEARALLHLVLDEIEASS